MNAESNRTQIRIAVNGAAGRMGRRVVALAGDDPQIVVAAALERADHPNLGKDAGSLAGVDAISVALTDSLDSDADAMIDFSLPDSALAACEVCAERGVALVLATTGFSEPQKEQILEAAEKIPLLWAPNMSRAVNLTMKLATMAAGALRDDAQGADVEILERHHRFKQDAPSGTALQFGAKIADVMGQTRHQHGREGFTGERPRDQIGYHAIRAGDNPGEHTIVFGLLGETIELTVRATNRDCYALGALAGAKFIAGKPAGHYDMFDVLGLE
ncbi:MAG: 4-hydroxy-tetrahydrodipicolinate reductase [Pirellulaceae bacterium]